DAPGAALAFITTPGQEKSKSLPERIDSQAPGHNGIAREMAFEKPEIRMDVQLTFPVALAVSSSILSNKGYPINHLHRALRQLHRGRLGHLEHGVQLRPGVTRLL